MKKRRLGSGAWAASLPWLISVVSILLCIGVISVRCFSSQVFVEVAFSKEIQASVAFVGVLLKNRVVGGTFHKSMVDHQHTENLVLITSSIISI